MRSLQKVANVISLEIYKENLVISWLSVLLVKEIRVVEEYQRSVTRVITKPVLSKDRNMYWVQLTMEASHPKKIAYYQSPP